MAACWGRRRAAMQPRSIRGSEAHATTRDRSWSAGAQRRLARHLRRAAGQVSALRRVRTDGGLCSRRRQRSSSAGRHSPSLPALWEQALARRASGRFRCRMVTARQVTTTDGRLAIAVGGRVSARFAARLRGGAPRAEAASDEGGAGTPAIAPRRPHSHPTNCWQRHSDARRSMIRSARGWAR